MAGCHVGEMEARAMGSTHDPYSDTAEMVPLLYLQSTVRA